MEGALFPGIFPRANYEGTEDLKDRLPIMQSNQYLKGEFYEVFKEEF